MTADFRKDGSDSLTLFMILDGFRHDFLEAAPYLKSIAGWHGKIRETFGFISTRPAMCAGVYPEQTNLCFEYRFAPHGSTFNPWLFHLLGWADPILPNRFLRLAATAWLRMTHREPVARRTAMIGHMPFSHFPLMDLAENRLQTEPEYLSIPTIYDLLRSHGQKHLYYGFARPERRFETMKRVYSWFVSGDLFESDRTMVDRCNRELRGERPNFAHLHFSACDWIGHRFGPDSPQMEEAIQTVDNWVKEVHEQALGCYGDVRILATADHGMVKVREHYDIGQDLLDPLPFSEPDDYLCFRDSTMARFWFFRPRAEDEIRKRLEKVSWGRVMDEEMQKKHHICFADNSNGDLIFLLEPGAVLLPNYYQAAGTPPKGMHGYAPEAPDNQGAIVIHDPHRSFAAPQGTTLDLVDVFPTLVDMHGLPLPHESMGSSVLTQ